MDNVPRHGEKRGPAGSDAEVAFAMRKHDAKPDVEEIVGDVPDPEYPLAKEMLRMNDNSE